MAVCYKKLWKMLIDKDMIKKDLRLRTGFSTSTMSKLSKDENVSIHSMMQDILRLLLNWLTILRNRNIGRKLLK